MSSPFENPVVPTPSGAPSGSGGVSGSLEQSGMGADPVHSAFYDAVVPTPGQGATANQSGLPPQVEIVGVDGAPGRNTSLDSPSMLETPKNNLASGG